jgi:hypothetical protein
MISIPDTALAQEASAIVRAVLPQSILHHSYRTFLLGRCYAERRRIVFDDEGLFLAALFHDLGLSDAWSDTSRAFTEIGATYVRAFLSERGTPERGAALAEAIELHMQLLPRWSYGSEAGLLQVGAWMDAVGLRSRRLGRISINEIEQAFPRGAFKKEFRSRILGSIGSIRSCVHLIFPGISSPG